MSTAIIVTSNNLSYIENCLESIRNQRPEITGEIIIVAWGNERQKIENIASKYDVPKVIKPSGDSKIPQNRNMALGKVDYNNTKYVLFLDDDTILLPNWHASVVAACSANMQYDLFASVTRFSNNHTMIQKCGHHLPDARPLDMYYMTKYEKNISLPNPVFPCQGCALVKIKVINKMRAMEKDIFDERYDSGICFDFGLKATLLGYKTMLINDAQTYHAGFPLPNKAFTNCQVFNQLKDRCLLYLKFYPESDRNRAFQLLDNNVKGKWYKDGYPNTPEIKGVKILDVYGKARAKADALWAENKSIKWAELTEKLDENDREKLLFGNWES
jgi:GT2 family glycosyltransferase